MIAPIRPIPRASEVIDRCAEVTGVPVTDILGPCRETAIVDARHLACVALREICKMSYPEIARKLGYRSHASVVSTVRHRPKPDQFGQWMIRVQVWAENRPVQPARDAAEGSDGSGVG